MGVTHQTAAVDLLAARLSGEITAPWSRGIRDATYRSAHLSFAPESGAPEYRYLLTRWWPGPEVTLGGEQAMHPRSPFMLFVMLNPSTADAMVDDQTVGKCMGFARREGFDHLRIVNLFALRSPHPAALAAHADPVGRWNDTVLADQTPRAARIVAAWGSHQPIRRLVGQRVTETLSRLAAEDLGRLECLGVNADGSPRHPARLAGSIPLTGWTP